MVEEYSSKKLIKTGKYYISKDCICCGVCTMIAPEICAVNMKSESGYIKLQPVTKSQIENLLKAISACPVNAICSDGLN